jgi:hypothetical protein
VQLAPKTEMNTCKLNNPSASLRNLLVLLRTLWLNIAYRFDV